MSDYNEQQKFWSEDFGNEYVERSKDLNTVNKIYKNQTGTDYTEIYESFFKDVDRNSKVIELATNVGLKLKIMHQLGFKNLSGVEINKKAYETAKKENPNITFYNSSVEDFDSKGEKYDVVIVSGFLIHVSPENLEKIIHKIVGLSSRYIFGSENFSENPTEVTYRGHKNKLWKQNFPNLFRKLYPNLKTIREERLPYRNEAVEDVTYLFEK